MRYAEIGSIRFYSLSPTKNRYQIITRNLLRYLSVTHSFSVFCTILHLDKRPDRY
nr:MAG TPA: hypothetical protein [Microviridae sp.]